VLRKDFIFDPYQVHEARAYGADAILLIVAILTDSELAELNELARKLGLETLVEAHDGAELERAVVLGAPVIGLNARDLSTFHIDRSAQLGLVALSHKVAPDSVVVAESGIHTRAQGAEAELAGADAILVGSALMRAPDPAGALSELLSRPLVKVCGLTREEDVAVAAEAGADLLGFVLAPQSPRAAAAVLPVPEGTLSVAVWVGEAGESPADLDQVHTREEGKVRGRDAVLLREGEVVARHLDLPWEEDDAAHWERAAAAGGRIMLAGRLGPDNVRAAIERVRPWGVDASSSLESAPGVKDHERVRAYVQEARV